MTEGEKKIILAAERYVYTFYVEKKSRDAGCMTTCAQHFRDLWLSSMEDKKDAETQLFLAALQNFPDSYVDPVAPPILKVLSPLEKGEG